MMKAMVCGVGSQLATTSDRVLSVLALFSGDKWQWTVEEAATALDLPTSTAYRYFRSLASAELLSTQLTGSYVLGPAVCELDRSMRMHDPFINAARQEMVSLVEAHGDVIILLARLYKDKVICVHREGTNLQASGYERGRPMPLDRGAASKVILANLTSRQLRKLSQTGGTDRANDIADLRQHLREIRTQGYSITRGEIDPTKVGISVPVFRGSQQLEGSLSFVIDAGRPTNEDELVKALIISRKAIEANLLGAQYGATQD
jgi:DNA-binding IclR family transcriptional regulator